MDEMILQNVAREYQDNFANLPKKTAMIGGLSLQGTQKEIDIVQRSLGQKSTERLDQSSKELF